MVCQETVGRRWEKIKEMSGEDSGWVLGLPVDSFRLRKVKEEESMESDMALPSVGRRAVPAVVVGHSITFL